VSYLEQHLPNLIAKKLVKEENNGYVVNLKDLGYDKLLGSGRITKKFIITAESASKKVVERVKKLGGEVILPSE
jgi:large subunit ribosomal protein L15